MSFPSKVFKHQGLVCHVSFPSTWTPNTSQIQAAPLGEAQSEDRGTGQGTESPLTHVDTHQGRNPCSCWDAEALCYCSIPQLSWPLWRIRGYLENFYFAWREVYCKVVARMRRVYWELPVFPSCRKKFKWQTQFLPQGFLLSVRWWDHDISFTNTVPE